MLAGAVREELWSPGSPVELAYIGGVFQSRILLEKFRTLVELQNGVSCGRAAARSGGRRLAGGVPERRAGARRLERYLGLGPPARV